MRPQRRFDRGRRRPPLASWGFLRPPSRFEDEHERLHDRLRAMPHLRREYRSSLLVQLVVIGALGLSCVVLLVQSLNLLIELERVPGLGSMAWLLPALVAALGLVALRRFLRVLAEYRRLGGMPGRDAGRDESSDET